MLFTHYITFCAILFYKIPHTQNTSQVVQVLLLLYTCLLNYNEVFKLYSNQKGQSLPDLEIYLQPLELLRGCLLFAMVS